MAVNNNGFIKIHRNITEWEWYTNANTFRLFIHLLLNANHADKKWQGIDIKRGQIIVGRKKLSHDLKMSEKEIRTAFSHLKKTGEVAIKTANKFSIVTICKYEDYQNSNNIEWPAERPAIGPAKGQQVATNKNDKKEKNILDWQKVYEYLRFATPQSISGEYLKIEATKFCEYYEGQQIRNLRSLCNAWASNIKPPVDKSKNLNWFI